MIDVRSDFTVRLHQSMGSDDAIVQAMLVSTQGLDAAEAEATVGRINFLMANRHGTPFEHGSMTFLIEAPIFVFREFHRHRVGWSYNEMSGRYRQLPPTFYVPPLGRPLRQVGKAGAYEFVPGSEEQHDEAHALLTFAYHRAYEAYEALLAAGVAKEVARACLPTGLYTAMFATCNPRSLMHFLSLRVKSEASTFKSYPQWEIEQVASAMEAALAERFPLTHAAFCKNGRVAP